MTVAFAAGSDVPALSVRASIAFSVPSVDGTDTRLGPAAPHAYRWQP